MIRAIVLAIVAIGAVSSVASADTVYVDPAGTNSGNGAKANPWKTLVYACNTAASGTVIKLNPGTFTETAQCKPNAGVSIIGSGRTGTTKSVVLAGWSSTGNFNNDGHLIRVENAGNQTIANFVIDGSARRLAGGIVTQKSDNLIIHDLDVLDFNWVGMWLKEGRNMDVYNCYVKDAGYESDGYCSGNISIASLTDSKIHDCRIYAYAANSGYGFKHMGDPSGLVRVKIYNMDIQVKATAAWNGGQASNMSLEMHGGRFEEVQISNSTLNMNVSLVGKNDYTGNAYSIRFHHNQLLTETGYGIETSTSHLIIDSNYIFLKTGGDGAFHDYGATESWTDISIHHNYIYNCRWRPIMFSARVSQFRFYNNTVEWFPDAAWVVYVAELGSNPKDDWIIQNNIFYCAKGTPGSIINGSVPTNFRFDNNCVKGLLLDLPASVQHNNIAVAPGWKLSGNRPRPYYEPASATSPIVNAGSLTGLPTITYGGSAVDIGAFEYQSLTSVELVPVAPLQGARSAGRLMMAGDHRWISSAWYLLNGRRGPANIQQGEVPLQVVAVKVPMECQGSRLGCEVGSGRRTFRITRP